MSQGLVGRKGGNFSTFVGVNSVSELRAPRGFSISLDVDLIQTC